MILSTPGVAPPSFSVTRRTANALPLNEWVSRRCKAFTLPHLPSFVAFTIRAWSRRTLWLVAFQSMSCHPSTSSWEAAPVLSTVICFASLIGLPNSLVMRDHMEVCPLSRGVILPLWLNSYPPHYRAAFAFSTFLYPQLHRLPLRVAFPFGRDMGLPCFALMSEWDGSNPFRRELWCSRQERTHLLYQLHYRFGSSLTAPLACSALRRLT